MSSKDTTVFRRPPTVAVSGHTAAAPGVSRPIRLATAMSAATPAKAKKSSTASGSCPASATKTATVSTACASSALKRPLSLPANGRAKTPARTPTVHTAANAAVTMATTNTAAHGTASATARTTAASTPTPAAHRSGALGNLTSTRASVAPSAPLAASFSPPPTAPKAHSPDAASTSTPSLAISYAGTSQAGGTAPTTFSIPVASAVTAVAGERYEPTSYKLGFALRGGYTCLEAVPSSAALWLGNHETGGLDVYSSTTGKLVVTLPPRRATSARLAVGARGKDRAGAQTGVTPRRSRDMVFPSSSPAASAALRVGTTSVSEMSLSAGGAQPVVKPTALKASRTHMWVGYEDGSVAVYDHLVLTLVTEGTFHPHRPVMGFAVLDDGTVISASEDGGLVHWDVEARGFEAIARLPPPMRSASEDGPLTCLLALPRSGAVLCGFHSGVVYAVDVYAAAHHVRSSSRGMDNTNSGNSDCDTYRGTLLTLHNARVNALAVLGDILFSAAEDATVCVSRLCFVMAATGDHAVTGGAVSGVGGGAGAAAQFQPVATFAMAPGIGPTSAQQAHVTWRLLKRIHARPCVRALLGDSATRSVYVSYADGLVERWSGNPDDDFGVEEVIREGMRAEEEGEGADAEDEKDTDATASKGKPKAHVASKRSTSLSSVPLRKAGMGSLEVTGLVAINAVETLQVLALSSNGVNKVWYGHRNELEENIASSISALNSVITEDARDTAVWRERLSLLRMKESERRAKYVLILEQLSEQRVLLKFYEKWRRRVVRSATGKSKEVVVRELEERCDYRLRSHYFGRWASFYDVQQTRIRRHTLAQALAKATKATYLVTLFHRWQMHMARRRIAASTESCASVLERASAARLAGPCYFRWMHHARTRAARRAGVEELKADRGLNSSLMAILAHKAQRQTLHRALGQWLAVVNERQRRTVNDRVWRQYVDVYAQLQDARLAKSLFQGWRRFAQRRRRFTALAAVAELRAQQWDFQLQQRTFLYWSQFLHQRHLATHAAEIRAVEERLKAAESEAGTDIFEKLQLQRHIDQLIHQQEREEASLRLDQARLRALQAARDTARQERAQEQQSQQVQRGEDGAALVAVLPGTIAALPATAADAASAAAITAASGAGGPGNACTAVAATATTAAKGPLSRHANYFRHLVEQQRLAPAVLAHMPLTDATGHVVAQLKGAVLNLYTDMCVFRQVKDRRRAGAAAATILLESFSEVKRLIVSSLRCGSSSTKATRSSSGRRAARWPLSLEALDSIPSHHCANVLNAVKMMVVSYDLLSASDAEGIAATCDEIVANADWIFLIARACYMRRMPPLPVNNRV